ncbi:MAG: hypothetical protein A2Y76_12155 [Planctomycetes bacterium RBG_13_60_9]|nr:MAG: hypothetical protein A2Y76_12155 [Planctomycetes bacterium RBG_13_60_9]
MCEDILAVGWQYQGRLVDDVPRVAGIPRLRGGRLCPRFEGRMPSTRKSKAKMASPLETIAKACGRDGRGTFSYTF